MGLNLHNIVRGAINAVNPDSTDGVIRRCTGYTKDTDGTQIPTYAPDIPNSIVQVQPLSYRDLKTLDALNITTVDIAAYVNGPLTGVDRKSGVGGDLVQVQGAWWLVTAVLEAWDPSAGWTKAGLTKQLTPP